MLGNTILRPIAFASKNLSGTERRCSNIDKETLGILHTFEKLHPFL